jgi:hypothetical protein
MKKISVLLNITLIAFIAIQSCNCPRNIVDSQENSQRLACPTSICMDYSNPITKFELLDHTILQGMANHYNTNMQNQLNFPSTSGADTRSLWLPLEKLKQFIWEIETNCCRSGCAIMPNLGIRIYYGRYTQQAITDFGLRSDYLDRHTLFMTPTFDAPDGTNTNYHYDFDPRYWAKDCTPLTLTKAIDSGLVKLSPGIIALAITSQNHGELCPPLCKPGNFTIDDFFTKSFPQ